MRDIFILNEILAEDKIGYIFCYALSLLEIFHLSLSSLPVLVPNYKQHILSSAKGRKVCYSLTELYFKSVHMNFSDRRGRAVHETFGRGGEAIKV
jgi:hypothetical protein